MSKSPFERIRTWKKGMVHYSAMEKAYDERNRENDGFEIGPEMMQQARMANKIMGEARAAGEVEEPPHQPSEAEKEFMEFVAVAMEKRLQENRVRAKQIVKFDPSKLHTKPNSIHTYIKRVLENNPAGLPIKEIIAGAIEQGYNSRNQYALYTTFSRALNNNYLLYERISKGRFRLRSIQTAVAVDVVAKQDPKQDFPDFKEVLMATARRYVSNTGVYPGLMTQLMKYLGIDCTYKEVYKLMQDKEMFVRDGFNYALADTKKGSVSGEGSARSETSSTTAK